VHPWCFPKHCSDECRGLETGHGIFHRENAMKKMQSANQPQRPCVKCKGTGTINVWKQGPKPCPVCMGSGKQGGYLTKATS
jgi:DnaJ-class molecular chaperone